MTQTNVEKNRAIVRNVFYGFSTWILPLALSFIATPVIVSSLGHEDYGIYALVLGFIAYSFNFNVGRAVTKYIAEYKLKNESEKIREVVSATFFLNICVGIIGLAAISLSAEWLVTDVFRIGSEAREKTVYALYLSALIIFFTMLNQVFSSILQGIHRFDVYSKAFNLINISLISGNLMLALLGYKLLALLVWNLSISIFAVLIYYRASKTLLPEMRINFGFRRETLKLVLNFSWGVIGYQILANLFLLFERSWITRGLGSENLTFYIVPMMLALYLHSFISSLTLVIFPLASELKEDRRKLLRLYLKATKIVLFLVVFLALTLMVESRTLLALWIGGEFPEKSADILIFHTITFGVAAIYIIAFQLAEGLGFPGFNFLMMAVGALVGILAMVGLTDFYGNKGVAVSRMAAFLTIFLSTFFIEKWFFREVQWKFWLKNSGLLLIAGLLAASIEKILAAHLPLGWIAFSTTVFCGGLVYCATLWLAGFVTAEDREFLKRISGK